MKHLGLSVLREKVLGKGDYSEMGIEIVLIAMWERVVKVLGSEGNGIRM